MVRITHPKRKKTQSVNGDVGIIGAAQVSPPSLLTSGSPPLPLYSGAKGIGTGRRRARPQIRHALVLFTSACRFILYHIFYPLHNVYLQS